MMWVNFAMFAAIQIGLLLALDLPDRLNYSPVKDWGATVPLALWIAVAIVMCASVWREEFADRPFSNWIYAAILPAFFVVWAIFIIAGFLLSAYALVLAILVLSFFCLPLLVLTLLCRIENPYGVDRITIPNYACLTGLLVLCLALICGGWRWGGVWNYEIAHFTGEERLYAEKALSDYEYCVDWSGGPERFAAISRGELSWRIVDVEILDEGRYHTELQHYTWMRIPTYAITFQGASGEHSCPLRGKHILPPR